MVIRKDIEVLPAETKELKLGWTVSEVIGVAVVNPRGVNGMKAVPKYVFENENGGIEIRRYSIQIFGSSESAAKAMAEDILKRKPTGLTVRDINTLPENNELQTWNYMKVIEVVCCNGQCTINLTDDGLGLIDPEIWSSFKKNVEKICNTLKAFL